MQASQGRRRGAVFALRITPEERCLLEELQRAEGGPRGIGPWLLHRALRGAMPRQRGITLPSQALPGPGTTRAIAGAIILDLCGGSGSWSAPYAAAGYDVRLVTLPDDDVRTYVPPQNVHGVLAAPPCEQFSRARRTPRDFVRGMETVNACLRIVLQARPSWWALENPTGLLWDFLGTPRDTWEPYHFGDPWTKRTSVWGDFELPRRGPFVEPQRSAMDRPTPEERAITPPGFARAFAEANP